MCKISTHFSSFCQIVLSRPPPPTPPAVEFCKQPSPIRVEQCEKELNYNEPQYRNILIYQSPKIY